MDLLFGRRLMEVESFAGESTFGWLGLILGRSTLCREAFEVITLPLLPLGLTCLRPSMSQMKAPPPGGRTLAFSSYSGSAPTAGIRWRLTGIFFLPVWN